MCDGVIGRSASWALPRRTLHRAACLQPVRRSIWLILAGTVLALLVVSRSLAGDLRVTVTGIRSDAGALMIGLYDSAERFNAAIVSSSSIGLLSDRGRVVGVTMRATAGTQGIGFLQLPPGRYAVIVFHDENDNRLLDTNFLGIPNEGYGFSNNATGLMGPPSFDAASVMVGDADQAIAISLIY